MNNRFVINILPLQDKFANRGIGRYLFNWIQSAYQITQKDPMFMKNWQWHLVGCKTIADFNLPLPLLDNKHLPHNWHYHQICPMPPKQSLLEIPWNWLYWKPALTKLSRTWEHDNVTYFLPHHQLWMPHYWRKITMVHDLIPLILNKYAARAWYNPLKKMEYNYYLKQLPKNSLIVTNSPDTTLQLKQRLGIKSRLMKTILLAPAPLFFKARNCPENYTYKPTSFPYFIYYGGYDHNKNVDQIIKIFHLFKAKFKSDCQLVLVGGKSWSSNLPHQLKKDLVATNFLNDEQLIGAILHSLGLFRLSLYEGFGLPEIETLVLNKPVISSNVGPFPDLIGQYAQLFNPQINLENKTESREILISLKHLYDNPKSRPPQPATDEFVKKLSWEKTVTEMLKETSFHL